MNAGAAPKATTSATDAALVDAVRAGDESAFEELFRRYYARVYAFVRRRVRDDHRAEDLTQEAFLKALRRLRETQAEVSFRPWIYEIARNSTIDHFRRVTRTEEVSVEAVDQLRASDHLRLVTDRGPDREVAAKQQLETLQGAFAELSDQHLRILIMRELEGLSYREIGERMQLTRPGVESTLFRARRRLETEFAELDTGRRCLTVRGAMGRLAGGLELRGDRGPVQRHVRRCAACNTMARELGLVLKRSSRVSRVAGILPLPFVPGVFGAKAAALVAAVVVAGGGAGLEAASTSHATRSQAPPRSASQAKRAEPAVPAPRPAAPRPARAPVRTVAARVEAAGASSARFASPVPQPAGPPMPVPPRPANRASDEREIPHAPAGAGPAAGLVGPGPQLVVEQGEAVLGDVLAPAPPDGAALPVSAPPAATVPAPPTRRSLSPHPARR